MPPVAAIAPAVLGAAGSASGGKKANKAANAQLALQKQAIQFGQGLANTGMSTAWTPAANYWAALLSGDPTKMAEATGPTRDILQSQGGANARELAARMPMGGEATAAQAANALSTSNAIARTYAGMQPTAANALGQLSSIPIGAGVSVMGQGAPQVGAGLLASQHAADQSSLAKGGLGTGLGKLLGSRKGGKSGGGGTSAPDPFVGASNIDWGAYA